MPWTRPGSCILRGKTFDPQYAKGLYDGHLALGRRADELGHDGFCLTDYYYAESRPPNILASQMAADDERVKIVLLETAFRDVQLDFVINILLSLGWPNRTWTETAPALMYPAVLTGGW